MKTDILYLFDYLKSTKISCAVIRNYHDIHKVYPSGDLDILINGGYFDLIKTNNIIKNFCINKDWSLYLSTNHSNVSINYYLFKSTSNGIQFLNLEFRTCLVYYEKLSYRSIPRPYLFGKDLNNSFIYYHSLPVLSPEYEFLNLLFEFLFESKHKYWNRLLHIFNANSKIPEFRKLLSLKIGIKSTNLIYDIFVASDLNLLINKTNKITSLIVSKSSKYSFWTFIHDTISLFYKIRFFIRPKGLFVVLLGPDGSGKTHICDNFKKKHLRSFPFIHRVHLGNRPILLSSLKGYNDSLGSSNQLDSEFSNNYHTINPNDPKFSLYSTFRFIYHVLDHIAHYWFVIRPSISFGSLFLSERYIFDYLAANKRYISGCPLWIKRFCTLFVPKPDYCFLLTVDPDLLFSRKKELPLDLLLYEQSCYRILSDKSGFTIINNNSDSMNTVSEIEKHIFK